MADRPVSILVDPALNIDDIRIALKHSSLEIEPTAFPTIFVVKATQVSAAGDTPRTSMFRQAH